MDLVQTVIIYINNPYLITHMILPAIFNQEEGLVDLLRLVVAALSGPTFVF